MEPLVVPFRNGRKARKDNPLAVRNQATATTIVATVAGLGLSLASEGYVAGQYVCPQLNHWSPSNTSARLNGHYVPFPGEAVCQVPRDPGPCSRSSPG